MMQDLFISAAKFFIYAIAMWLDAQEGKKE